MHHSRRAKIVATVGPSSSDLETIENLIKAGVNVFRLNFSHGKKEDHKKIFDIIHLASKNIGKAVGVLQDLQGPKLRVGVFPGGSIEIQKGEEVLMVHEKKVDEIQVKVGKQKIIPYNYEKLAYEVKERHRILLDDGNMELVVTNIQGEIIKAQVVFGGILKDKKGMNYPDTKISIESFTPKDREDLLFGMQLGVDYVAVSFVRTANDVRTVQKFMHSHKKNIPVVSKIEKGEAIHNLKEILEVTDCVMVARGDLAVEIGTAPVPSLQKQIIYECKSRGIPVITATQMLESMISTPRPTRAEASDVANAVLDGTDALMLSAESASGKFPVLAVSTMANIILETELRQRTDLHQFETEHTFKVNKKLKNMNQSIQVVDAVEQAAANIATWVDVKAIVCTTHTGRAARALARYRPLCPVVAFTDDPVVERQLALVWGIDTGSMSAKLSLEKMIEVAEDGLIKKQFVQKGDLIVFTAGWPPLKYGTTNFLKVLAVQKEAELKKSSGPGSQGDDQLLGYRTRDAQFVIDQKLCIQCGGCVEVCPNDIFGMHNRKVYLKEDNCKNCTFDNECMKICPTNAIEVIRLEE